VHDVVRHGVRQVVRHSVRHVAPRRATSRHAAQTFGPATAQMIARTSIRKPMRRIERITARRASPAVARF